MKINGKDFALNKSTTVSEYLEKNGYVQAHIVVELNEKIFRVYFGSWYIFLTNILEKRHKAGVIILEKRQYCCIFVLD